MCHSRVLDIVAMRGALHKLRLGSGNVVCTDTIGYLLRTGEVARPRCLVFTLGGRRYVRVCHPSGAGWPYALHPILVSGDSVVHLYCGHPSFTPLANPRHRHLRAHHLENWLSGRG